MAETAYAFVILIAVIIECLLPAVARRVSSANVEGAAASVTVCVCLAVLHAVKEVQACLAVLAAAGRAFEVEVASVVERFKSKVADAAWDAFALGAALSSQVTVQVLTAELFNVLGICWQVHQVVTYVYGSCVRQAER